MSEKMSHLMGGGHPKMHLRTPITDLKTWMAGSAEKLRQSGRHIGPVKEPS